MARVTKKAEQALIERMEKQQQERMEVDTTVTLEEAQRAARRRGEIEVVGTKLTQDKLLKGLTTMATPTLGNPYFGGIYPSTTSSIMSRYSPERMQEEFSLDGGKTWQPVPRATGGLMPVPQPPRHPEYLQIKCLAEAAGVADASEYLFKVEVEQRGILVTAVNGDEYHCKRVVWSDFMGSGNPIVLAIVELEDAIRGQQPA